MQGSLGEEERDELVARNAGFSYQSYNPLSTQAHALTSLAHSNIRRGANNSSTVYIPATSSNARSNMATSHSLSTVHTSFGKILNGYKTIGGYDNVDNDSNDGNANANATKATSYFALPESRALRLLLAASLLCIGLWGSASTITSTRTDPITKPARLYGAWSSLAEPFSSLDPQTLGLLPADRPKLSRPGPIFGDIREDTPLPTNSWCQNLFLGSPTTQENNHVFQLPYIIDPAGAVPGMRTHGAHVQANDRSVMMTYEPANGLTLGAVDEFLPQHKVIQNGQSVGRLSLVLEWASQLRESTGHGPGMRCPLVRGAPYTTMEYVSAAPLIVAQRKLSTQPIADDSTKVHCGSSALPSAATFTVQKSLRLTFDTSDMTWMVFVSEPTEFMCFTSNVTETVDTSLSPGVVPPPHVPPTLFELRATKPYEKGVVRIAMANNCTLGVNAQHCDRRGVPRDNEAYVKLLEKHADIYPTGFADIYFTFPVESLEEEELRLNFNWEQTSMSDFAATDSADDFAYPSYVGKNNVNVNFDVLVYGIPHHQERLQPTAEITRLKVHSEGCTPTLHGLACPIVATAWSQLEHLHPVSFHAGHTPRPEMLPAIAEALKDDISYDIPLNYKKGAGDTYFSGKMLAKLGRILLIADENKGAVPDADFADALARLQEGVEIWINGSAASPLLYDEHWGGVVMCGCDYDGDNSACHNAYPNCPALVDPGQNFGAGWYNDHHYHYGYHIYAAAVLSKFNPQWMRKYWEHVLLLVRDIANPSSKDRYFPTFRHKDWFLGFSWASGVVTIQGKPYPNGRNQESSSEAIHAYEAVSLFGHVALEYFSMSADPEEERLAEVAKRVKDMGRLLCATELRSAKLYWHVQSRDNDANVSRIYPDVYTPKVVGMLWSMLAQEQTWFGAEPWKSYGIQLLPITAIAGQRDDVSWTKEMLPLLTESCMNDPHCEEQGWSVLVFTSLATIGRWKEGWAGVAALDDSIYMSAGGNGHSKSNTLWYIATRGGGSE